MKKIILFMLVFLMALQLVIAAPFRRTDIKYRLPLGNDSNDFYGVYNFTNDGIHSVTFNGTAAKFDSGSYYRQLTGPSGSNINYSMCIKASLDQEPYSPGYLISDSVSNTAFNLWMDDAAGNNLMFVPPEVVVSSSFIVGEWRSICFSTEGNRIIFWSDTIITQNRSQSYNLNYDYIRIGRSYTTRPWAGSASELCVFNREITQTDVDEYQVYGCSRVITCTPNWQCSQYNDCITKPYNHKTCSAVIDLNSCGDSYIGDMSEFDQTCTITSDNNGVVAILNVQKTTAVTTQINPIEQLIFNIRNWLLNLLGLKP